MSESLANAAPALRPVHGVTRSVCGRPWQVNNYEGGGSGPVSVREATRRSVNGVYGRLMERLCPNRVAEMAERLGIPSIPPGKRVPSMALGSAAVRPLASGEQILQ